MLYSNAKVSHIRFGATNKGATLDDGYSDQRKHIQWDDGNVSDDGYTHKRQKSKIQKATKALRKAVPR